MQEITWLYLSKSSIEKEKSLTLDGKSETGSYLIKLVWSCFCLGLLKSSLGIFLTKLPYEDFLFLFCFKVFLLESPQYQKLQHYGRDSKSQLNIFYQVSLKNLLVMSASAAYYYAKFFLEGSVFHLNDITDFKQLYRVCLLLSLKRRFSIMNANEVLKFCLLESMDYQ